MPVADIGRLERQLEPLPVLHPYLRYAEGARHVIVLDPSQMPAQPGDRVRVVIEPGRQLAGGQTLDSLVDGFLHPAERIRQKFRTSHATHLPQSKEEFIRTARRDTPRRPAPVSRVVAPRGCTRYRFEVPP